MTRPQFWLVATVMGSCWWQTATVSASEIGHGSAVTDLQWVDDGRFLLVAAADRIYVHQWPSLTMDRQISVPMDRVFDIETADDGSTLLVAGGTPGESGILASIDWSSGAIVWQQTVSDDVAYAIASRNSLMIAALHDHSVTTLQAESGRTPTRWGGHSKPVVCVLALNDDMVLTGSLDQTIRVRQLESGAVIRSLNNHTQPVTALALRPGGPRLPMVASVSEDRTVRFWQPTIGRLVRFRRLPAPADCVAFSADGAVAFCGARDGNVYAVSVDTLNVKTIENVSATWINSIAVHPTQATAVAGDADGHVRRFPLPVFGDDK